MGVWMTPTGHVFKKKKPNHFILIVLEHSDKFLLKQLPKPTIHQNYKIQDILSQLCGSYCL